MNLGSVKIEQFWGRETATESWLLNGLRKVEMSKDEVPSIISMAIRAPWTDKLVKQWHSGIH
jgi:hypothetical protein